MPHMIQLNFSFDWVLNCKKSACDSSLGVVKKASRYSDSFQMFIIFHVKPHTEE